MSKHCCPVVIKDPEGQDDFGDDSTQANLGDAPDIEENLIEGDFQSCFSEIR
jgi:hypothetical protein